MKIEGTIMRLLTGVLIIAIGAVLTDPVPEAAAALGTAKNKLPHRKKASAGPIDVWSRIRSGMGLLHPVAAEPAATASGLQAAARSRPAKPLFEARRHPDAGSRSSKAAFDAAPQTGLASSDSELSPPVFAPPRYTALGRKLLGAKSLPDNAADCVPSAPKRRPGDALAADRGTVLPAWEERTRTGKGHHGSRRKPGLGSSDSPDGPQASSRLSRLMRAEAAVKTASRCAGFRSAALGPDRQPTGTENRPEKQAFPDGQQAEVDRRIDKFIGVYTRNPDFLYRVAERAHPYLYHIVEELSRYRLPLELALLPIVESAYLPTAESPKNARGLWQFIPGTGSDYDLAQSRDYDERLDIPKSTQAAIRFLSGLYRHFNGDWLLALAAYNAGQAAVDNAVSQNRGKGLPADFWSLNLPRETQDYVPRLLALSAIFASPARYGIQLPFVRDEPYFVRVKIDREADVNYLAKKKIAAIAALADLSPDQFSRLNPCYLGGILSRKQAYEFLLPPENALRLRRRLAGQARFRAEPEMSRNAGLPAEKPETGTDESLAGTPVKGLKYAVPFLTLGVDAGSNLPAEAGL
jgi:hypothetical protein